MIDGSVTEPLGGGGQRGGDADGPRGPETEREERGDRPVLDGERRRIGISLQLRQHDGVHAEHDERELPGGPAPGERHGDGVDRHTNMYARAPRKLHRRATLPTEVRAMVRANEKGATMDTVISEASHGTGSSTGTGIGNGMGNGNHPRVPRLEPAAAACGLVPSWMAMGAGMAEGVIRTSFGVLEDAHHEARACVVATTDWAGAIAQSVVRLGRAVIDRLEALSAEAIARGERTAHSVVGVFHTPAQRDQTGSQ